MMDPTLAAELTAHEVSDEEFVEAAFRHVLRRPPDSEARDRAVSKLAAGTLSRATLIHELTSSEDFKRVCELDDAVALGLGARERRERIRWLQAPSGTDERVVEIPWVLSRLRKSGRVLEVGYAFAETAYLGGLLRAGVELVGADLATRDVEGIETVEADVRNLPFPERSFDQVLLVSTLEHVGADNTVYGLGAESDEAARLDALKSWLECSAVTAACSSPSRSASLAITAGSDKRMSTVGRSCSRVRTSSSRSSRRMSCSPRVGARLRHSVRRVCATGSAARLPPRCSAPIFPLVVSGTSRLREGSERRRDDVLRARIGACDLTTGNFLRTDRSSRGG